MQWVQHCHKLFITVLFFWCPRLQENNKVQVTLTTLVPSVICFICLSNKYEAKFYSYQRFLMIGSGTSGMPLMKWWCTLVYKQEYFLVSGCHSPFQTCQELQDWCTSYTSTTVMSVSIWQDFTCLKHLGFSDFPIISNGISQDPSIFAYTKTVILSLLLLCLWQLSLLKACVLSECRQKQPTLTCIKYILWIVFTKCWKHSHLLGTYLFFNYTFGFTAHGSVARSCMFSESYKPSIQRYEFNV
jgi:hypothetical protein